MASFQILLAIAFVCLAGKASATLKDHCSDVSFWDVVRYKTSSKQCCDTSLQQTCVWKNENVCRYVTELQCEPIAWAECTTKTTSIQGKKCEVEYKDYDFKDCKEVKYNTPHSKQVPECKQVTKNNCVTDWEVDASGNKVWAGTETCTPFSWEECKIVEKQVDFPSVKTDCNILESCGELCDLSKPITPGSYIGSVKAKIDCEALFEMKEIDSSGSGDPLKWEEIPRLLQQQFTHFNSIRRTDWYLNDRDSGAGREQPQVFSKKFVTDLVDKAVEGHPVTDFYPPAGAILTKALKEGISIKNKTILVIGSQKPWLEAILLANGAASIMTLEYGRFICDHPQIEFVRPDDFRRLYHQEKLPLFDAVFTYSSVEHSGLGRYGDAINPWGDIITIARAWCVSSPEAMLAVGVPTNLHHDTIMFNAHRVYGPILYPFLTTNWNIIWSSDGLNKSQSSFPNRDEYVHQPLLVFQKINNP